MDKFFKTTLVLVTMLMFTGYGSAKADDKLELETVTIKGNRELPKVLYIVPWKRLKNDDFDQKLVLHSLFQDAFDPIDPEAFERHIENYKRFSANPGKE